MIQKIWGIVSILAVILASCREEGGGPAPARQSPFSPRFAVYYGSHLKPGWLSHYDWVIVQDTVHPSASDRPVYFAYLSLGEIDRDGPIARSIQRLPGGLASVTLRENVFWNSVVSDLRMEVVRQALLTRVDRDVRQGYGGIFLDTLDSTIEYRRTHPRRGKGLRQALLTLVREIHGSYPGLHIIVNRGFEILPVLANDISGDLYEDFCSRYDENTKKYGLVPPEERREILPFISRARTINPSLAVLALDYDDPTHPMFLRRCQEMAKRFGFSHFVSDLALDTTGLERSGR